jgi:flagellar biosynthesis/type III secretory pathway M-ring protein FliF/YscJ
MGYATYGAPPELQDGSQEESPAEAARNKTTHEKRLALKDNILNYAKEDPRATSNMVKKWLRT